MKIFGVPFDPANSPERLNLKLAYLGQFSDGHINYANSFRDPYDIIYANFVNSRSNLDNAIWLGKLPVDSWLTPRPQIQDIPKLNMHECISFLVRNGCWDYTLKVASLLKMFPS